MSSKTIQLSILIPIFNEEKTIREILTQVYKLSIPGVKIEIIVIDDGSTDASASEIANIKNEISKIKLIRHTINQGKGAAIKSGLKKAKGEYILIQDADLEYNPKFINELLQPLIRNEAKVVYGTRLKRFPNFRRDEKTLRFFIHYLGNKFLSLLTSILYGQWITDMETGYKLFPKKVFLENRIKAKGFEVEPEITAKLLKKHYHIVEVPIQTMPRGYKEGKKLQTIPDGIKALETLIKYRFMD